MDSNPECCGIQVNCCDGATLPNSATATISAPDCSCLDGQSVPMRATDDGFRGEKDDVCNGNKLEVIATCTTVGEQTGFAVDVACGDQSGFLFPSPTDCPPEKPFKITASMDASSFTDCCGEFGGGEISVVIE